MAAITIAFFFSGGRGQKNVDNFIFFFVYLKIIIKLKLKTIGRRYNISFLSKYVTLYNTGLCVTDEFSSATQGLFFFSLEIWGVYGGVTHPPQAVGEMKSEMKKMRNEKRVKL